MNPIVIASFVFAIVADLVQMVAPSSSIRWALFGHGCTLPELLLFAVALVDLAARPGVRRAWLLAAAGLWGVRVAWLVAFPFVLRELASAHALAAYNDIVYALAALELAGTIVFVHGVRGWRRAPAASVLVVAGALLGIVATHRLDAASRLVATGLWIGGASWLIVRTPCGHELADAPLAARGLRRAARALWLRVVVVAVTIVAAVATENVMLVLVFGPVVIAGATVLAIVALLDVARARVVPVQQVVVGAALVAWSLGVQLCQLPVVYGMLDASLATRELDVLAPWSVVAPLAGLAGFITVALALATLPGLRRAALVRALIFGLLGIASLVLSLDFMNASLQALLLYVVTSVWGLVAYVRLLTQAADTVTEAPGLPAARVVAG